MSQCRVKYVLYLQQAHFNYRLKLVKKIIPPIQNTIKRISVTVNSLKFSTSGRFSFAITSLILESMFLARVLAASALDQQIHEPATGIYSY